MKRIHYCICVITTFFVIPAITTAQLELHYDKAAGTIIVYKSDNDTPLLTQNASRNFRPYIHPILAPDGKGVITESSPLFNPHETGIFWGFTKANDRDYFNNPTKNTSRDRSDYWRRVSLNILKPKSSQSDPRVRWQSVYDLLNKNGDSILRETQVWAMEYKDDSYILDFQWHGIAMEDITIGEFENSGLFVRMPWRAGTKTELVTSIREHDQDADGEHAIWIDLGMEIEGRDDLAHVAVFDHPENHGYPHTWRVDERFGVGPIFAGTSYPSIESGDTISVKHRLIIYTGRLNDIDLMNSWGLYTQQTAEVAEGGYWGGESVENLLRNTDARPGANWEIGKKSDRREEFLTPDEALNAMTLLDGFEVNLFASEPMIRQPMAFCWDDRGRLWIAENLDMMGASQKTVEGIQVSKENSRILILEDTDRDGKADKTTVFIEGVVFPSGMAVGLDGLWLGAPPNLLFIPDRDRDDKADLNDIEVRLTGWGEDDLHETFNSFYWGPDGWLYGTQGTFTYSRVGKPTGTSAVFKKKAPYPDSFEYKDEPIDINGGVWRYHPLKDRFEVVAHGFSNPWGIDYNAKGQLFATVTVIPHLWHIIPGGIYHRQAYSHFNLNAYDDISTIADHRHRSAHGGARLYLSDAFPDKYQGQVFMGNIHEHALLTDILEKRGSGFVGRHGEDLMKANNAQFIGFSVEIGPEGGVYMLDWHDADICGDTVLTKDTGRIYRIVPTSSLAEDWDTRYNDLRSLSDDALVDLQLSASSWHARRARVVLQNRGKKGELNDDTFSDLLRIFNSNSNEDHRLRALWALHISGGLSPNLLEESLNDKDEYVRAWSIQLLCEDFSPSGKAIRKFEIMAKEDSSAVVRLYLASALQRLKFEKRWRIARNLVMHEQDSDDHNIPKILWYGIEPIINSNPDKALRFASASKIHSITRYIARRLTVSNQLKDLVDEIGKNSNSRDLLLLGMLDGLEGRIDINAPKNWKKVYQKLRMSGGENSFLALQISLQFGDAVAAETLLETLRNKNSSIEDRRKAIRGLTDQKHPELKPELIALFKDEILRKDAIRAVASYNDPALGKILLDYYSIFPADDKLEIVNSLASRPDYGWQLTQAIERGDIPRRDVPPYAARLLKRSVGNRFIGIWGSVEGLSPDIEADFEKYSHILSDNSISKGNLINGRQIFNETCSNCHELYGEGGKVGPDLTGSNRTNIDYLLGNILTPSAVIKENYKMTIVSTEDGQFYSGVLAAEDRRNLLLRIANTDDPVRIPKSQVLDRETTDLSMMPEGLLKHLSEKEVIDLFSYLVSLDPVMVE